MPRRDGQSLYLGVYPDGEVCIGTERQIRMFCRDGNGTHGLNIPLWKVPADEEDILLLDPDHPTPPVEVDPDEAGYAEEPTFGEKDLREELLRLRIRQRDLELVSGVEGVEGFEGEHAAVAARLARVGEVLAGARARANAARVVAKERRRGKVEGRVKGSMG